MKTSTQHIAIGLTTLLRRILDVVDAIALPTTVFVHRERSTLVLRAGPEDLLLGAGSELMHIRLQLWIAHLTLQASDRAASLECFIETIGARPVEA